MAQHETDYKIIRVISVGACERSALSVCPQLWGQISRKLREIGGSYHMISYHIIPSGLPMAPHP